MINKPIRIFSGKYRSTRIIVPNIPGLRPTLGRVRETLFNWLYNLWKGEFHNKSVLDLFAGSGALGFEAASRGFSKVDMFEINKKAVHALHVLKKRINAENVNIKLSNSEIAIQHLNLQFDLILLDPPFNQNLIEKIWLKLPRILKNKGLIYIESNIALQDIKDFRFKYQGKVSNVYFYLLGQIDK
ncbi:MAG: 16S rRNA (guanine(966)-N(2))-methyltransferase RsmD [Bordetella sp.]|nr:MAG: 16S rRNA (guanine(966)-N(2))-methyltransferase RsmD [Bordetella sp.]